MSSYLPCYFGNMVLLCVSCFIKLYQATLSPTVCSGITHFLG